MNVEVTTVLPVRLDGEPVAAGTTMTLPAGRAAALVAGGLATTRQLPLRGVWPVEADFAGVDVET